jgi:hypothetical protein
MSRVLLATTLAAAGASGFLTSSCPSINVDIACMLANDCVNAIVLIHGPEGKFYDPILYDYAEQSEDLLTEMAGIMVGIIPTDTVEDILELTAIGETGDFLCGSSDGTGVAVNTLGADVGENYAQISMDPENNGSGCKCSDMYFTIIVQETAPEGDARLGILYNHKLESTTEASVAYGTSLVMGDEMVLDIDQRSFTVKFTPDGSSTSSWLNWWIFSHWF